MTVEIKAAVSVAEMARMVGLSRARFYQLVGSAFPPPVYDVSTKRPFYDELLQESCLEVRRRNCGIDGKPILFYARPTSLDDGSKKRPAIVRGPNKELLEGLRSLGLSSDLCPGRNGHQFDLPKGGRRRRSRRPHPSNVHPS